MPPKSNSVLPHPNTIRKNKKDDNSNDRKKKGRNIFLSILKFFFTYTLFVQVENVVFAGVQCYYCIWRPNEVLEFFGQSLEAIFSKKLVVLLGCFQISFAILALQCILTFNKDHSKIACPLFIVYAAAICYSLYELKELKEFNTTYLVIFSSTFYLCLRNCTFLFT